MNAEEEHEEFVDWLYLGQTEVEPDELNEKVVKCMWLAWQARQVYAKRRKKMNIRPLESLTKEELIELIKHEHRDEPVAWQPIEMAPEEGCWAIVYGDGAVDCMFIRKGHVPENWTNPNNPNLNPSKVTHWMSIPKFGEEG